MSNLQIEINPEVELVFEGYPTSVRKKMANLRRIVIEAAEEIEGLLNLEETLKWGEPSYLAKNGSTVRIDWKKSKPDQYAVYFKCTSKLVSTFKMVYGEIFTFEGMRAIAFRLDDKLHEAELKKCITTALRYHKVKKLPLLGMMNEGHSLSSLIE
ncbi:MAG: DUF1801 domain-containing protein [Cytophagales bacterium]|nr:DUF1801 domain-containing protein [Cytophagales bacterium]